MLIFFSIVLCAIIIGATSKKKSKPTAYPIGPAVKPLQSSIPINPKALELSTKHFGIEWMQFRASQGYTVKISNAEIRRLIAIGYSRMGVKPLEHLLISFLTQQTAGNGGDLAVPGNNYCHLHRSTLTLIKQGRFTQEGVEGMLRSLAEAARTEQLRQKAEQKAKGLRIESFAFNKREEVAMKLSPAVTPETIPAPSENELIETKAKSIQDSDPSIIEVGFTPQLLKFDEQNIPADKVNQSIQPAYLTYDPDQYLLGKKYKTKLSLSPQECSWLNKFHNYSNVFNAIEGCEIETIKLYLKALKKISNRLKKQGSSLKQEIEPLVLKQADFERSQPYYWGGYGGNDLGKSAETEVYYSVYKKAEKAVREVWGHRRKISADFSSRSEDVKALFSSHLGSIVEEIVESLKYTIGIPDASTELSLNEVNTTRWKDKFQEITSSIPIAGLENTTASLYDLGTKNVRNPSVENIYYEASKFIAAYDKLESLRLYLHYIWHDLQSLVVDNKHLNKTIQKKLFSNEHQVNTFTGIIDDLSRTKDLDSALAAVQNVYKAPRKTIVLDTSLIKKVEDAHSGTVAVLSEYLQDAEETYELKPPAKAPTILEEAIASTGLSTVQATVDLNAIQLAFLDLFAPNNIVDTTTVEDYAKRHGVFKNQLIDSINEQCYELLDDVLIEEAEDGYETNSMYLKQIISK